MILVVGESIVDVVERPDGGRNEHAGGSPANVAAGLGRLGLDVTLATSIGDDAYGELMASYLADSGVIITDASHHTGATASAVARLDHSGSATYDFDITWDPGPIAAPADVVAVHTGSIAATVPPGADEVEVLVRELTPTALVSFDPNLRPALVPDRAEVEARVQRLVALADVVKVSDEDLAWLHPTEAADAVTERWLASGPSIVVLTRGGEGSTALARSGRVDLPAEPTTVVDTVGAGDSYMAGLLAGLSHEGLLTGERRADLRAIDTDTLGRVVADAAFAARWTVGRAGAQMPDTMAR